jgi:hypothetical protein
VTGVGVTGRDVWQLWQILAIATLCRAIISALQGDLKISRAHLQGSFKISKSPLGNFNRIDNK